jgi:hypothetical protein
MSRSVTSVEASGGCRDISIVAVNGRLFSLPVEGNLSSGPEYFRMRLNEFAPTFRLVS